MARHDPRLGIRPLECLTSADLDAVALAEAEDGAAAASGLERVLPPSDVAARKEAAAAGGGARGAHSLGLSHTADRHFLGAAARRRRGTGGRAGGVPRCGRGGEDGGGQAAEARAAASAEAPGRIAWLAALRPMLSVPRRLLGLQTSLPGLWLRVSLWHMRVPG